MDTAIRNSTWEKHQPIEKRRLTLLCVFAVAAIVGLVIGVVSVLLLEYHGKDDRCMSPECIHTASSVLNYMDLSVEPCDDFYQFSCGNFLRTQFIPAAEDSVTAFSEVDNKVKEQLKSLIEETPPESAPKHLRMPNKLYKACMNKTLIEELGSNPVAEIANSLGGWPVIKGKTWNSDNSWTWQDAIKKFSKLGLGKDYIFAFTISTDLKNSAKRIIEIDEANIALYREYFVNGINDTNVDAYFNFMIDMAVLFGAKKDVALRELRESVQFEMDLANICLSKEERRNISGLHNLKSIGELQATYPYVSWKEYFNSILPDGVDVDDDEIINVLVPSFFEKLGPLLAKTPSRVIANYMMWRIHSFSALFLSEKFRKRKTEYEMKLIGVQAEETRWKECVDISSAGLDFAVASLYVRKHFDEEAKHIAVEMVNDIRSTFGSILRNVDWMDEQTRKFALEKLSTLTAHIGYPVEIIDDSILEKYYQKLEIDSSQYLQSFLNIKIFNGQKAREVLHLPINKTDWTLREVPTTANALFKPDENVIEFPAAILQGKFFHAKRPKYMNYGAIGSVIGHEITHAFDDEGKQFDSNGNLVDWWQKDTEEVYLAKAHCIIDQYSNYTDLLTGMNLSGINTQGENIADNGGIKDSYIAYNSWAAKNGPEPKLPGLDFSPKQMFWIAAAQVWCSKIRKESLEIDITIDPHSPGEFRVLGPLRNNKEFAKDFHCPKGSPMNPVQKCEVW